MKSLKEINQLKAERQEEFFKKWKANRGKGGLVWACVLGDTKIKVRKISNKNSHNILEE